MKEIVFFLLGAAVGAAVALLLAPSSGEELRAQIHATAKKDLDRLESDWHEGMEKTNVKLDKLQADLKQILQQEQIETEEAV